MSNICGSTCNRNRSRVASAVHRTRGFVGGRNQQPHVLITGLKRSNRSQKTGVVTDTFTSLKFSISVKPLFRAPRRIYRRTLSTSIRTINVDALTTTRDALVPRLLRVLQSRNTKRMIIIYKNIVPRRSRTNLCGRNITTVFKPNSRIPRTTHQIVSVVSGGSPEAPSP